WSWFFPSEADRLRRARAKMAARNFEAARKELMHVSGDEAEALYAECSAAIDQADRAGLKKELADQGFHGWKVEVSSGGARRRAEVEREVTAELAKEGVNLDLPALDEDAVKRALARVQRRIASSGRAPVAVRLVPLVDAKARR